MNQNLQPLSEPSVFEPNPDEPARFLRVCPVYHETPLTEIHFPSGFRILLKDETQRMNLGSFKALGGVYAVAKLLSEQWETVSGKKLVPEDLLTPDVKKFARTVTFVCASAGNHGMAVAAGARIFGSKARIYLSQEVPDGFEDRLRRQGADVERSGDTYEESVVAAIQDSEKTGAILLADGSWSGYTHPPSLVMEGYTIIAEELRQSFKANNVWPTHVFLQAGVGGLAGAITYMIRKNWAVQPQIFIVEPDAAPCLRESHRAGKLVRTEGPVSNMGRLDCKEASVIAHGILEKSAVTYITVSDNEALDAANYLKANDLPTTPSGAAGMAGLKKTLTQNSEHPAFKPLIIVTEGVI